MTCKELADFLMAYLDRELPDAQREVFESHLERCPPCLAYLETYQETVRLGKEACCEPDGPVPEEVPERLVAAIIAARSR
jgi:anti-sigma factor (TIGR02949 family)